MTGSDPAGEWPPSPARLFSALVAADGTGPRCKVTDGTELEALERLPPPMIVADVDPIATRLVDRFVVKDETAAGMVQNYPGRVATQVHPGVRFSPEHPVITYLWDDVAPGVADALGRRAARVGYLGCADSPARVDVGRVDAVPAGPCWRPVEARGVALPVPYPGFVEALDALFDQWSDGGAARRSWVRTVRHRYSMSSSSETVTEPAVLHLAFNRAVVGRHARLISDTLRRAVIDHSARLVGDAGIPWVVHGHGIPDDVSRPYQLARYLALPDVGSRHSDGRLHGAAVWIPAGISIEDMTTIQRAVWGIERLHLPGWFDLTVTAHDGRRKPYAARPERWSRSSRVHSGAFPVVHERGGRRGPTTDEVRRWFVNAGHPSPVEISVSPVPQLEGAVWLRPREVHGPDRELFPYSWVTVRFDEPVAGPLCVGRSRSFGMGLFAPVTDSGGGSRQ